jgi:hypothetical protein
MPALSSLAGIEVVEGDTRKTLSVSPIRLNTHASVSLTFDRRYRRSIQLTRKQLVAFAHDCLDVAHGLSEDR